MLSHRWAGQADRTKLLGGQLKGQSEACTEHALKKYRKGISCCDRTHPGTLVTQYFTMPTFHCLIDVRVPLICLMVLMKKRHAYYKM